MEMTAGVRSDLLRLRGCLGCSSSGIVDEMGFLQAAAAAQPSDVKSATMYTIISVASEWELR